MRRVVEELLRNDMLRAAGGFLLRVVAFFVLIALIPVLDPYRPVEALVTKAEQLCDFYHPKTTALWPERKPTPPGSIPCDAAKERELDRLYYPEFAARRRDMKVTSRMNDMFACVEGRLRYRELIA